MRMMKKYFLAFLALSIARRSFPLAEAQNTSSNVLSGTGVDPDLRCADVGPIASFAQFLLNFRSEIGPRLSQVSSGQDIWGLLRGRFPSEIGYFYLSNRSRIGRDNELYRYETSAFTNRMLVGLDFPLRVLFGKGGRGLLIRERFAIISQERTIKAINLNSSPPEQVTSAFVCINGYYDYLVSGSITEPVASQIRASADDLQEGVDAILKKSNGDLEGLFSNSGPMISAVEARSFLRGKWPTMTPGQRDASVALALSSLLAAETVYRSSGLRALVGRSAKSIGQSVGARALMATGGKSASAQIAAILGAGAISAGSAIAAPLDAIQLSGDAALAPQGIGYFFSAVGAERLITFDDKNFRYFNDDSGGVLAEYVVLLARQVRDANL